MKHFQFKLKNNKMKNIYFVRHANYENNELKICNLNPKIKIELSKKGLKQIEKNKSKIENINFDKIITSEFYRTQKTAQLLTNSKKEKITINKVLNEILIGDDKMSYEKHNILVKNQIEKNIKREKDEDILIKIKQLEKFLNELKKTDFENILICTHKDVLRLIKIINEKLDLKEFYNLNFENCEIYKI